MIEGVRIEALKKYEDERGWVAEIYRHDGVDHIPHMAYASFSGYNIVRGPHEHVLQTDLFCFFGPGDFLMALWDARGNSATKGVHETLIVGESNPVAILIPPGVVHGYRCVSQTGGWCVNLPNALYAGVAKLGAIDEIRHEKTQPPVYVVPELVT